MGLWSSIHRVRSIEGLGDSAKGEIKLFLNDEEQTLYHPIEVYEEFLLGKNLLRIHHWFVMYAKERWDIEPDGSVIDECFADNLAVDFEDIVRLSEIIKKVIANPELGKKLLPYDPEYVKEYNVDEEYDENDIDRLKSVNALLEQIIEENGKNKLIDYYKYYAA